MRNKLRLAVGVAALLFGGAAYAEDTSTVTGDAVKGRKAAGMCRTCHGLDGIARIPIAPHIGGENETYLANQLTAFRDGTRKHEMMTVVSASLSDQAIADLAAWYSSLEVAVQPPASHNGLDGPEDCTGCHGVNGLAEVDDAPNLAGETDMYIIAQLQAFRIGRRKHDVMTGIAAELTDDDIQDLADWYSAIEYTTEMPE